jgi:hypothetical protein
MDYSKFKEQLGRIKTATSIQGKTYDKIHVSGDSIYYERESGSDESISIKELYYIYQNLSFINTTILRDYITGRKFSPSFAILISAGYYDGSGRRLSNSSISAKQELSPQPGKENNVELQIVDIDEQSGRGTKAEETFFAAMRNLLDHQYVFAKSLGKTLNSSQVYLKSDYREMHFPEPINDLFKRVLDDLGSDFSFPSNSMIHHIDGMVINHPVLGTRIIEFDEEQHFTPAKLLTVNAVDEFEPSQMNKYYKIICSNNDYFHQYVLQKHRIKLSDSSSVPTWSQLKEALVQKDNAGNGYIKPKSGFPFIGGRIAQRAYYDLLRDMAHYSDFNKPRLLPAIRFPMFLMETLNEKSFNNLTIREIQNSIKEYLALLDFDVSKL